MFGIQVGVAITILVRREERARRAAEPRKDYGRATIRYAEAGDRWRKGEKYEWLAEAGDLTGLDWRELKPNARHVWLTSDLADDWYDLLPLASDAERRSDEPNETTILDEYCRGVETTRDAWVYGFDPFRLGERVERFVDTYNAQVVKWQRKQGPSSTVEGVVTHDDTKIKWSSSLKNSLRARVFADYNEHAIRRAMYRPFVSKCLYFDRLLLHRPGQFDSYFPTPETENRAIWLKVGSAWPMFALMVDRPADVLPQGGSQCIPLYVYRPLLDGAEAADGETEVDLGGVRYARRENLTDWALEQFQTRYAGEEPRPYEGSDRVRWTSDVHLTVGGDNVDVRGMTPVINKEDVFHYVYAVLHHRAYRERYAADLKRSLPRIPFAPSFWPLAEAGRDLADLHVGYETAPEADLTLIHEEGSPLTYRVERMRLDEEAGTLRLNDSLTLEGIPPEAHRYRLGNRSALAWLVDQIRIKEDKRSGIVHDPNAAFEGDEIVRLIKRVTHVSVETVRIVEGLPDLGLPE